MKIIQMEESVYTDITAMMKNYDEMVKALGYYTVLHKTIVEAVRTNSVLSVSDKGHIIADHTSLDIAAMEQYERITNEDRA
jgi:hypothetical protein